MGWLNHPAYVPVREHLIARLRAEIHFFKRTPPILFVCGGNRSERRSRLVDYLKGRHKALVFLADDVWLHLAKTPDLNALAMEAHLAELADMVILVVESPGTFAQLGAFAVGDTLRRKLLPILDQRYRQAESFIATGPVRWVDADSRFAPCVFADFDVILSAAAELDARIARIQHPPRVSRVAPGSLVENPRLTLFFLSDLVAIVGPASASDLRYYLQRVVDRPTQQATVEQALALGIALSILARYDPPVGDPVYVRADSPSVAQRFQRNRFFVSVLRAKVMEALGRIPEAATLLDAVTSRTSPGSPPSLPTTALS
jgi:hypothetical protein